MWKLLRHVQCVLLFGMGKVTVLVMIYSSVSSRRKTAGYIILRQISYSFELVPKRVMTSLEFQQKLDIYFIESNMIKLHEVQQ